VSDSVVVTANAKVTLTLRVTGVRNDGYHELTALVVSAAAPHDTVTVTPAAATTVTVRGHFADGIPDDATNLAALAAGALERDARIEIDKGIPAGAGLGGGSADAAATLVGLREAYSIPMSDRELSWIGASLGSDVPACLRGGSLVMRGRGERLQPDSSVPPLWLVIVTPRFACSTPAVYRAWDELGGPRGRVFDAGVARLEHVVNDLEPAAWHVEPRLRELCAAIEQHAGVPPILAGSGSSYVVPFLDQSRARVAADRLVGDVDGDVWCAPTTDRGVCVDPP
jgi:4-diphosphocytidyl-2-C-methyl-D-erythritol kinase